MSKFTKCIEELTYFTPKFKIVYRKKNTRFLNNFILQKVNKYLSSDHWNDLKINTKVRIFYPKL